MGNLRVMAKHRQASGIRLESIESAAIGADPKNARMILADGADTHVAQRRAVVYEIIAGGVVAAQSAVRAHPNGALAVRIEGNHRIRRQGTDITLAMPEMTDAACRRIQDVQPLIQSAGPDTSLGVDEERANRIARQSIWLAGVVSELPKLLGAPVPVRHAAAVGRDPQIPARIFNHRPDIVAGEAMLIAALAAVFTDRIAVVAIQAAFGRKPQISLRVLKDAV